MRYLEDALQIQCVNWFKRQYPHRIIFHIPSGRGKFSIYVARKMKSLGVLAGVPDLFIPEPNTLFSSQSFKGLFIEMKSKKGKESPIQKKFFPELRDRGYGVETCNSFEEFTTVVKNYLGAR